MLQKTRSIRRSLWKALKAMAHVTMIKEAGEVGTVLYKCLMVRIFTDILFKASANPAHFDSLPEMCPKLSRRVDKLLKLYKNDAFLSGADSVFSRTVTYTAELRRGNTCVVSSSALKRGKEFWLSGCC